MEIEEFEENLETNNYTCFDDLRAFKGVIKGEIVIPTDDGEKTAKHLDEFSQDEELLIFNLEEFIKWYQALQLAVEEETR